MTVIDTLPGIGGGGGFGVGVGMGVGVGVGVGGGGGGGVGGGVIGGGGVPDPVTVNVIAFETWLPFRTVTERVPAFATSAA
jgi:hypothetical protein